MKKKVVIFGVLLISMCNSIVSAQSTQFSFQGQMQISGAVANGVFDFEFALFGSALGGGQLGSTLTRGGINVANGIFSVSLDFGNQFDGSARFLEIRVRQSGGSFTTLSPRQSVSSSPYAVRSLEAQNAINAQTAASSLTAVTASNATNATNAINLIGPLVGDVTGTQGATIVTRLRGTNVAATVPTNGQVLKFNSGASQWQPATDETSTGSGGGTITGVTAGTGLSGGGTTGSVTLNIANGGVNTAHLADSSVTDVKIVGISGAKVTGVVANAVSAANATNASQLGGIPAAGFIQNSIAAQASSNFNISGNGTAGGTLSGNLVEAATQFNLGGNRILSSPGTSLIAGFGAGSAGISNDNAFFGFKAGALNTTAVGNAFFGAFAGEANTQGSINAIFGANAGSNNTTGSGNAIFGKSAGLMNTTGINNVFVGLFAARSNTTGNNNIIIGDNADVTVSGISNATAIGSRAAVGASNSLVLGGITGINGGSSTNVGIGTTTPTERLHVVGNGLFTGNVTVNGNFNATLPGGSGNYIQNTTTPQASSNFNISGTGTAAILNGLTQFNLAGQRVLFATNSNVFVGPGVGNSSGANAINNAIVGNSAGFSLQFGSNNAFLGFEAGRNNSNGSSNTFIGVGAGSVNEIGLNNTAIGAGSGVAVNNLDFATAIGSGSVVSTSNTVRLGRPADTVQVPGSLSVTGNSTISGNVNTGGRYEIDGGRVLSTAAFSSTTFLGINAGNTASTATSNTFVGFNSGSAITNGLNNAFFGRGSGVSNTTGFGNSFFGMESGGSNVGGVDNAFFGLAAGAGNSVGSQNVFLGARAGDTNTLGSNNTVLGALADLGSGELTFATAIGAGAVVNSNSTIVLGRPVDNVHIEGTLRVDNLLAATATPVCRTNANRLAFCSSSARYKTDVHNFNPGLDLVKRLRPVSFNWITDKTRDVGLIAEEVAKVEPLLVTYDNKGGIEGVKYDRVSILLVNAVKEQQVRIEDQQRQIAEQRRQIESLTRIVCSMNPKAESCQK
jgi:trimeric autotransporter adhesin